MLSIIFCAIILDMFVADINALSRYIYHPVQWIGNVAIYLEKITNKGSYIGQFWIGCLVAVFLIGLSAAFAYSLLYGAQLINGHFIVSVFFLAWLIASRSLYDSVRQVWLQKNDLSKARTALSHIVGRKTENLDENKISRAAIETLAENFSDGVIAPLFYFALCEYFGYGLVGLCVYKTINTLDSLYGYKNQRYFYFGKFSAILDDVVNLIPARLTALLIALGGVLFAPKLLVPAIMQSLRGIKPIWHYYFSANSHSPNACWPEWLFATLLDIQLGGIREYEGGMVQENFVGNVGNADKGSKGNINVTFNHIAHALKLYRFTMLVLLIGLGCGVAFSYRY